MPGMIRFMLGLVVVGFAAGADVTASNTQILAVAAVGIMLMISGTNALKKANKYDS